MAAKNGRKGFSYVFGPDMPGAKKRRKAVPMTPEVAMLSNLNLREFTQEELDADPLLAAIVEDRRLRK